MSDARSPDDIEAPPQHPLAILRKLGPGLIIAASIVGSGELIMTTLTGAQAGMTLLWLIIIGCMVKVFAQIEIGRYTLASGKPTLTALAEVPGPRIEGRGNWLVWYWFVMWFLSIGQLGGIAGGVGQTLSIAMPLTQQGADYQRWIAAKSAESIEQAIEKRSRTAAKPIDLAQGATASKLGSDYLARYSKDGKSPPPAPLDDRLWAIPIAIGTSILLLVGRYQTIQTVATLLVAIFTFVTVGNVLHIQRLPDWRITPSQWIEGFSFRFSPAGQQEAGWSAIAMALSTLGIIGVGAAELVQYPYWCLEKGYARWTGPNDGTPEWTQRARGWLRVMRWDAWASMLIYTIATIAFYLLGAAILHRAQLNPSGSELIQTLMVMYEPLFASWAPIFFLIGAFAILYSTFFVANASHARTFADGMAVVGWIPDSTADRDRWVRWLSGLFPLLCLAIYWVLPKPVLLVFLSGLAQAIMLPMLFAAAAFFRYRRTPPQLRPSILWDVGLWISGLVMVAIGVSSLISNLMNWKH
jgi:Mn2+/Fe2+ NRAMP family transporter